MFSLYIDADSLPKPHRAIILKRLLKESDYIKECVFASDRILSDVRDVIEEHTASLRRPLRDKLEKEELKKIKSNIKMIVVDVGSNSADDYLVENSITPAFAITHDVPLSSRLINKGLVVLDDRGHIYDKSNIRERLSERDFMTELREIGISLEKTKGFDQRILNDFASAFDSVFNKYKKDYPSTSV